MFNPSKINGYKFKAQPDNRHFTGKFEKRVHFISFHSLGGSESEEVSAIYKDVFEWCDEFVIANYAIGFGYTEDYRPVQWFWFEAEKDAVLFKLRWG